MNDKILWDIIDRLRDELNIASDGIVDLNDVVRDLQAESIEQIKDNKKLKAELDKARKGNIDSIMDVGLDNERLQAENNDLKVELELLQGGDEQGLILSNQLRDVEIKELKDKLQAVNIDNNNV